MSGGQLSKFYIFNKHCLRIEELLCACAYTERFSDVILQLNFKKKKKKKKKKKRKNHHS